MWSLKEKSIFCSIVDAAIFTRTISLNKTLNMKKIFLPAVMVLLTLSGLKAQPARSVYVELFGPGVAAINYDTRFSNREDGIGGRVGIGGFSIDGASVVFMPLALNYLIGKDQRNYFELGAGVTPIFGNDNANSGDTFSSTFGHLSVGYRLQPKESGFTFRAAITPIFGNGFFWPIYGGVSFGYKF